MSQAQESSRRNGVQRRAGWGTLSRAQIVEAALRAIRQSGGYEQMTIRSVAADIGVSPMALYRHVRDKDDLLDEVVDRLLVRAWKPKCDPGDWKAWVGEAADRFRNFLVTQPAALHVYLQRPAVSPTAITRMEAMLAVLRREFDEPAAGRAYAAIHTYTIGFAALEASRGALEFAGQIGPGPRQDGCSATDQLVSQLAAYTTPHQFVEGLRYLLDGIDGQRHTG